MNYTIRIAESPVEFPGNAEQTVLEAAMAAGIELPYSCRKGVCTTCAAPVLEGSVRGGETQGTETLLCRAHPCSDLRIAPRNWSRIDPAARRTIAAKVFRCERITRDVWMLRLRFPAGIRAKFRAGQYLEIVLSDGQRRTFSMANPPQESDGATLFIREVDQGRFTGQILPELAQGDPLEIEIAYGDFRLREDRGGPIVLVAGGTGIAPIASILEDLRLRRVDRAPRLFWGVRTREDLFGEKLIERWRRTLPGFEFVPVLSDEPPDSGWQGKRGFVHTSVLEAFSDLSDATVYACGAPPMIAAARDAFSAERGLPADAFFADTFVTGPAPG